MNLFGLSPGELFLIMFVAMIVLGPEKLPETAASVGKWIREFRRATQELTQQFAEDNPFAEIQRALTLTDEPAAPTPVAASETVATTEAVAPVAVPAVVAAEAITPTFYQPAQSAPIARRSDYFDRPALFDPIQDRWAHGSLEDFTERVMRRIKPMIADAIADEWAHGVPLVTSVAPVEPASANGHDAAVSTDFASSLNFSFGLNSNGAAHADVASPSDPLAPDNGDVAGAPLDDLSTDMVEGTSIDVSAGVVADAPTTEPEPEREREAVPPIASVAEQPEPAVIGPPPSATASEAEPDVVLPSSHPTHNGISSMTSDSSDGELVAAGLATPGEEKGNP